MLLAFYLQLLAHPLARLEQLFLRWTELPQASSTLGSALDLTRSKSQLMLENAQLKRELGR